MKLEKILLAFIGIMLSTSSYAHEDSILVKIESTRNDNQKLMTQSILTALKGVSTGFTARNGSTSYTVFNATCSVKGGFASAICQIPTPTIVQHFEGSAAFDIIKLLRLRGVGRGFITAARGNAFVVTESISCTEAGNAHEKITCFIKGV